MKTAPAGTFAVANGLAVTRMGYGAMQLAGPHVFGRAAAVAVLREAIDLGIMHIDTSDFYGPHVTNQIIKEALYPYPADVHIVTKGGARRDETGGWPRALAPQGLRQAIHDNLKHLAQIGMVNGFGLYGNCHPPREVGGGQWRRVWSRQHERSHEETDRNNHSEDHKLTTLRPYCARERGTARDRRPRGARSAAPSATTGGARHRPRD